MSHALRSSRGRLGIEPMTPYVHSDLPELPCMQYIRVINDSPNTWILRGQSSFTQLFFHPRMREDSDGHWENKYSKVRKLFPYFSAQKKILPDGRLVFTLGDSILRMNKLVAPIDTAMKMPENLYEQIDITCGYTLNPCEFVVASLLPAVNCPSHAGIRLLSRNLPGDCTRLIDAHQVNAQWVDPGYANSITCHPIRRGIPQLIRNAFCYRSGLYL
jgi:hypothetical protein